MLKIKTLFVVLLGFSCAVYAADTPQEHSEEMHQEEGHQHGESHHAEYGPGECMPVDAHEEFEVGEVAMHHIGDANVFSIGHFSLPLPCIFYAPGEGWDVFLSSRFRVDGFGNGNGHVAYNGYVLHRGTAKRIRDNNFPDGEVAIEGFGFNNIEVDGKEKEEEFVCVDGEKYVLDKKSTADAGLFGGGITSYYDFSITKNVATMIIILLLLGWVFLRVARTYDQRTGKAPKGLQSFIEPIITFIRDDVAKPFLEERWEKYFTLLLSIFFFILGLNLFGQIPIFGNANVTGNLAVTMMLAIIAFVVTNVSGNAHYWKHILVAPGVPAFVKPILIPVEILGLFIKPLTLMLRLFANITAGHMVVVVFVGLIFVFGDSGNNIPGTFGAAVGSTLLTMFMMTIEVIVAFVQAFVFTILTASYIGAATEEEHH